MHGVKEQRRRVVNLLQKWNFLLFFLRGKTSEVNRKLFKTYIYLTGEQNT